MFHLSEQPLSEQPQPSETAEDRPDADAQQTAGQEMSSLQRAEAKQYGNSQLACDLADKALDLLYLGTMAFLFARPLTEWIGGYLESPTAQLAVLFLITIGLHECVSFPLSCYSGFVLEHRYGLSHQSFAAWFVRHAKHYSLAVGFGLVMFVALFWMIWLTGNLWWLVAAAAFFLVSVVLGQLAPVLFLPLFYKIERLDDEELKQRMMRLAEGTGLSIEGVYRMVMSEETAKANAMLAGLGSTRRVIMGDTLLDKFTPEEIEVIFAHEVGHHVHRHLPKLLLAGIIYSAVGFWLCDLVLALMFSDAAGVLDRGALPVAALPLLMFCLNVFSLVIEPITNVISRHYERQCDRYALRRTGLVAAYRSAFRKLAVVNKDDPQPNRLAVFLFHSHPPISERIAMADQ
jgi:STE24 endopeptidase